MDLLYPINESLDFFFLEFEEGDAWEERVGREYVRAV
jgi:hypothetical protein